MTGSYIRRFRPGKIHIIAAILLMVSLILFLIGAYRAIRVFSPKDISDGGSISRGDCVKIYQPDVLYGNFYGGTTDHTIMWANIDGKDSCIIYADGKLRPLTIFDDGLDDWLERGGNYKAIESYELVGIVTDKYSDGFMDYMDKLYDHYDKVNGAYGLEISADNCSELGIKAVDPAREKASLTYGLPFLIAGLILLTIAGSPFFYAPEDSPEIDKK